MSRVALLGAAAAPLTARRYYDGGDPGPLVAALATVPELLEVFLPFVSTVLGASALDARTKEIVIVRTSAVLRCEYCVDTHCVVALDEGVTVAEVGVLRDPDTATDHVLTERREDVLVQWVDAVAGGRGPVADELAAALASCYAEHEVVELTLLVGATMMLNRFCTALELPTSAEVLARLTAEGLRG